MRGIKQVQRRLEMKKIFLLLLVFGVILIGPSGLMAAEKPRLAILPFFIERVSDPARGAVCSLCQIPYKPGNILPGSQKTLTQLLQQQMESMDTFEVLPPEKGEEAFSKSDQEQFELQPARSAMQMGKALNTDFIFVGEVFRFEERIGSAMGVEKPASVGFDIHLFRTRDGKMVWSEKFDETQKSLSDNLLEIGTFVKEKGTWVTAKELSKIGMEKIIKKMPGPKTLEEVP
jgi:hypothetical protein